MQWTDVPWGLLLTICWYHLHQKKFCLWKQCWQISQACTARGGAAAVGEFVPLVGFELALGCMLSCLRSSYKCLQLLPGLFWHHVKDTSWMRDQALKLQIVAWSTKHIDSSHLLGRAVAAGNSCHCFFVTLQCCLFEALTYSFFLVQRSKSFLFFVVPYFHLSLGKLGVFSFPLAKKSSCSLCMQSIHHFN